MTQKRAKSLNSDKIDLSVLREEEVKILELLDKGPAFLAEIQEQCFGTKYAVSTGVANENGRHDRPEGKRYVSGTSVARNMLRRLKRSGLVVRANKRRPAKYKLAAKTRKLMARHLVGLGKPAKAKTKSAA